MSRDKLPILPTSVVGSHGRPGWLYVFREATAGRELGSIDIQEVGDDAVRLAILDQLEAGIDVISDGEMRRTMGYYRGYMARFRNVTPAKEPPLRQLGAIHYDFIRRHDVVGPIGAPEGLGIVDEFKFLKRHTTKPTKATCAGPLNFARECNIIAHYKSLFDLAYDFAKIINAELKGLAAAGADFIQVDEPSYVHVKEEPTEMAKLFNATVEGVKAKVALHVCFGTHAGRPRMTRRTYRQLFPKILEARADQFVFEFANRQMSEVELWKEFSVDREIGLGVVDVKAYEIETPEDVADRIRAALKHIPAEKMWINPDCGMGQSPRWICVEKLKAMVTGTRIVRHELGFKD
ncbi:MAG: methionine synthase [Deltaproteobacteria bacterium]|nr:methionine synthase [Deltaproteobacteria bacterium]